ncbi:MAG TPA: flippase [Gallionella sp.]|nr:flippase [Gallionella sp.]
MKKIIKRRIDAIRDVALDHHAKEILSKSAIAFILRIVGTGLAFLMQIVIGRYLGASGAGLYFLAFTITTLLATISMLGMDNSVTRFVAAHAVEKNWSKVGGVVSQALLLTIVVSVLMSVLLFFLADWVSISLFNKPELAKPLLLMSFFILPLSLVVIYTSALQGLKYVRDVMLLQSVTTPAIALVAMYFFIPLFGLAGAVVSYGCGIVITLVIGLLLWNRAKAVWGKILTHFSAKALLSSSITLLGAVLLQQIMMALPLLLLGVWGSSADAGMFSAAQRTASLIGLVLVSANVIVAPKFAELYQQNDIEALGKVARQGALLMTVMASPALLLFLFVPEWVMGLFGAEFSAGWLLLVIMALGQLVNVMTGSVGFILVMTGYEKQVFIAALWGGGINLLLCVALIPPYGAVGAGVATSISIASINLLRVRYVWKTIGVMPIPFIWRMQPR